jgi:hypothetical protein
MNDPMTTETAAMFMRQRDDAWQAWGRAYNACLLAVEAWEAEFGGNEPPAWVLQARAVLMEPFDEATERDIERGQELAKEHGWD